MKLYLLITTALCLFYSTQYIYAQGIIKDDFLVNDDAGSADQFEPSISMDATGNFVITWRDFRNSDGDVYFQRFNDTGTPLGVNTIVNDDPQGSSQEHPAVSMDGAGDFVVVWDDLRNVHYDIDIYFQRYTSTGSALGVNTKVNDDIDSLKQWSPSIAMDATGNFVIVWIDERNGNRDIYFQRYTSTGTPLGANIKVNNDATNSDQISPSISMDATGNFVIAWQDFRNSNWDIYFQRFTDTGTTLGNNTKANDDAGNDFQYYPSISMDGIGDFVVTWQDFRNSNWDINFQRYTNTGTTLGNNVKVNDDAGTAYQKLPTISTEGAGDFVIVWEDFRNGQTNSDIFGQRYFSNGNTNGTNYSIVADGPNNGESTPVICANISDIIFSWQDNRRSQGWDIYAKIVNWNWNGVTVIEDEWNSHPTDFSLSQNYPNPFNPSTKIKFTIPGKVILSEAKNLTTLKVFDVLGNEVAILVNEEKPAGEFEVEFNVGRDSSPDIASGVYFYQLKAGSFIQTKKMIFIK